MSTSIGSLAVGGPEKGSNAPVGTGGRSVILTATDQLLSSASNALMLFALGQVSSVDEFATIGILVAVALTFLGFNRGGLGTPVLLVSNLPRSAILAESGYALSWAFLVAVVGAAPALLVAGGVMGDWTVGVAFALAIPFVLAQDVLRMACIALNRPVVAVLSDGFWTACMAGLFVANLIGVGALPLSVVGCWGVGAVVACAIPLAVTGVLPRSADLMGWWLTYWRARVRFGGLWSVNQLGVVLVLSIAATLVGSAAAAGLRGAYALFGPITILISAVPLVFVPHARRAAGSVDDEWHLLVKSSLAMSVLTLVATTVLMVTPSSMGAALIGSSWKPAAELVPYVGLESAMLCWLVSVYSYLQACGLSKLLIRFKLIQLGIQLCACTAAGIVFVTSAAIGLALAASAMFTTVCGLQIVRRRQPRSARNRLRFGGLVHAGGRG